MKRLFFVIVTLLSFLPAIAKHIAGGELFYEYLSSNANSHTSTYQITLRLFRDCQSTGPLLEAEKVTVGIYESGQLKISLPLGMQDAVRKIQLNTASFPCLSGAPVVCYEVAVYANTVELPDNVVGYTLSRVGCCRIDGITNLGGARNVGSNYVTKIPGTSTLATGNNSSPQFNVRDTALVCTGKNFNLDFGAVDPDNDVLTFSFCEAYGAASGSNNSAPSNQLTLDPLRYTGFFSGSSPLGSGVQINPTTGIISGTAPASGSYVVNVCITEWRNGIAFSEHRKDFILKVQDCDLIEAALPDKIIQCDNFTVHFENQSSASGITSYRWDFGTPNLPNNTSSDPIVNHLYADTGRYIAKLEVTGPRGCIGIDSTVVLVYPGFFPKMNVVGSCVQNPYQFTDLSSATYGNISTRLWDLGDETISTDTSTLQQFKYQYTIAATKTIQLIVATSKGCIDTLAQPIIIRNEPVLLLPFKDTLICNIDSLKLGVGGDGIFSWLPNKNILNANTANPLVYPTNTTTYYVTVNDNGCKGTDSIKVNVLSFITANLGADSAICQTDAIQLHPVSEGLAYRWTASTGEIVADTKYPMVRPLVNTRYALAVNLGKCAAADSINIKVAPYPIAHLSNDTSICNGYRVNLFANIVGSSFKWSPTNSLINANTLQPIAGPTKTTAYLITVIDTLGCPKPTTDTIIVKIMPKVVAFAGRDTAVVLNQPLQLNASGGIHYTWTPTTSLNNPLIFNPIAVFDNAFDSIKYKVTVTDSAGCFSSDEMVVRIYKSGPEIFIPTAFTPNGDYKNDLLKPITVGISRLHFFSIYNRWGQLVFITTELGKGWDGLFNGAKQPSGAYVFIAEGTDYLGNNVYRKGTTVLIR